MVAGLGLLCSFVICFLSLKFLVKDSDVAQGDVKKSHILYCASNIDNNVSACDVFDTLEKSNVKPNF